MTQDKSISRYRAEVIEQTINVEWLMNAIICQHYLKRVVKEFLLEVLYDEYFSFGLKRRILEKVIDDPDQEQMQKLNRINTIRNYFAHCGQEMFAGKALPPEGAKGSVPDPRNPQRLIDFEKLHGEFVSIVGGITQYLGEVYQAKGGELYQYRNGHLIKVRR